MNVLCDYRRSAVGSGVRAAVPADVVHCAGGDKELSGPVPEGDQ